MKKILIIFILLYNILEADNNYELKLYETIIPTIFKTRPIKVYVDNDMKEVLKNSSKFRLVDVCDSSVSLIIGKKFDTLPPECKDKPLFSTSYRIFKNNSNSFGAFYWRKGRPQIKFKSETLKKYNLTLPKSLKKYEL